MNSTESRYINREISWLEFNQRVLDEALDTSNPLLERLKFLAITASNLDEFFMVRVGGLQLLCEQGNDAADPSGLSPEEQLAAIGERTRKMTADQYACYLDELAPQLAEKGIKHVRPEELSEKQEAVLERLFDTEIYSVLSPMAVTSAEDFPLLINQTLNICVQLTPASSEEGEPRFAIIPFGRFPLRFITLPSEGGYEYCLLEDAVETFITRFFPGEEVVASAPFRITRNADFGVREDLAADMLQEMERLLNARKSGDCVRLEIADSASEPLLAFLQSTLNVDDRDVFRIPGPLDMSTYMRLTDLKGFEYLKWPPWPPQHSPLIDQTLGMFEVISHGDILLYHPYDSFEPVVRLIEEAAHDQDVLAIKQTLYRTSRNSPIVAALMQAANNGKHVTAIVELKARFDEARNISWAKDMERAGVQVIYGVKGLKTHAKICIIIRREPHGIVRYVHFGTGNYNEATARLYSDVSYMTCNEDLGADATSFFNAVTGYSQPQKYRAIEAAPIGLRDRVLEMIATETERKRQGQEARIMAKLNSLVDPQIIEALYEASCAGVEISLNIRGICCLRPGVPGMSENIKVTSIVDRFLEHARILYFLHGGDERVFISSADWMPRNLDRRVELLVPVDDPACRDRLIEILNIHLQDTSKSRRLLPDGSYERIAPRNGEEAFRSQRALYWRVSEAVKAAEQTRRTVFEPHRAPGSEL